MIRRDRAAYPAQQFRDRRRLWLLANWRLLVIVLVVATGTAWLPTWWADGYLLGLLQAGILGVFAVAMSALFFATTGTAGQLAGAWGEDLTRDELDKARRRRLVWGSVHGVATAGGDVDHLVVSQRAGVLALDSKWRNNLRGRDLARDADAARAAARRAELVLRSLHHPMTVTPVVVVWGPSRRSVPATAGFDGVEFIDGGRLVHWFGSRPPAPVIDEGTAQQLLQDLRSFKARVRPELCRTRPVKRVVRGSARSRAR